MPSYEYFQQYTGYFWQWEENGSVASIRGGATIAYKEYIADAVEKLADGGLPLFGSLLLAVIATNPEAGASLFAVENIIEQKLNKNLNREPLNGAIRFLKQLSALPPKYKKGRNRLLLLQTLFAGCHNRVSESNTKLALKFFWKTRTIDEAWIAPKPFHYNLYYEEFTVIKLLAKKFPDNDALLAAMASLPVVEEELLIEEPENKEAHENDCIEALMDNPKTFPAGSLVKRLWSGLNIPFHNALPSQQLLGGVSDITNKGDLHRLLISEFANDDAVFLSRLANNEVLYLNREAPPQNNNLHRIVLLDVSLKNWGTPKAVAFAVLLAIAKHPKTDIACSAFAVGDGCTPLRFDSVDDVIESLQVLEPCLHPARGMEKFFSEHGSQKNREVFFISSPDTLRQPELHKVLSDRASSLRYLIQTDGEGGIDVYKRQQASRKHVQRLQLPLEELWKKAPKEREPVQPKKNGGVYYPILFPAAANPRKVLVNDNGDLFIITAERNLIASWKKEDKQWKGWEMLYEGLPGFTEAEIGTDRDGKLLLLLFNESNRKVTLLDVRRNYSRSVHFPEWDKAAPRHFMSLNNAFVFFHFHPAKEYWTFHLNEEVIVKHHSGFSTQIHARHMTVKEMYGRMSYRQFVSHSVFKNITSVFINQLGNLVFNRHELRLTDHNVIKLEKTGFIKQEIVAMGNGSHFRFPDGSTVTVSRSGMIALKSSDASKEEIYVPSVVEAALGMATASQFAGYDYYLFEKRGQQRMLPKRFWERHMHPFIEIIKAHGA